MTPQEKKLWYHLRLRNINGSRFRRQHPIGPYIVDFVCIHKKLIIEVDGGQHNQQENIEYDAERSQYLTSKGFTTLRFCNTDVDNNIAAILEEIMKHL